MSMIKLISDETGLSLPYVEKLVRKAPHSYRTYGIPKHDGTMRRIDHPSAELKILQYWMIERVLRHLPVHEAVHSYRTGRSIVTHADQHRRSRYLIRMDLENFFPSITGGDVRSLLKKNIGRIPIRLDADALRTVERIVCRSVDGGVRRALTIGAPTSPSISNAILYELDKAVSKFCFDRDIIYTRYADDLYFSTSTPGLLKDIPILIKSLLGSLAWPRLKVKDEKTIFTSKKRRRVVTGVVLTSEGKLSVGRDAKRATRSLVYRALSGRLELGELESLRGKLSYYRSVEPSYFLSLEKKFGEASVFQLMSGVFGGEK